MESDDFKSQEDGNTINVDNEFAMILLICKELENQQNCLDFKYID